MNKKAAIIIAAVVVAAGCGFGGWMYHNAQLDKMRAAGVDALHAAVVLDDYREEQQAEIQTIFDDSEAKINACKDQDSVDKINQEAAADYKQIPVKIMDDVAMVSCGDGFTGIIKQDNSLWMTGINYEGQLGDGTDEEKYTPVMVMGDQAGGAQDEDITTPGHVNVKVVTKSVKAKNLKKKALTVSPIEVTGAQRNVIYSGTGINAKSKKALKISKKTGKITVKKKTKKGTYKMRVNVIITGNADYAPEVRTALVTVKVK